MSEHRPRCAITLGYNSCTCAWSGIREMTLSEFLLARIAEDETSARAASFGPWALDEIADVWREDLDGQPHLIARRMFESDAAHIVRHDPPRVLAECEAKRRIVARMSDADWDDAEEAVIGGILAAAYADHPDYREEWKV